MQSIIVNSSYADGLLKMWKCEVNDGLPSVPTDCCNKLCNARLIATPTLAYYILRIEILFNMEDLGSSVDAVHHIDDICESSSRELTGQSALDPAVLDQMTNSPTAQVDCCAVAIDPSAALDPPAIDHCAPVSCVTQDDDNDDVKFSAANGFDEENITFSPPLYKQRYELVANILHCHQPASVCLSCISTCASPLHSSDECNCYNETSPFPTKFISYCRPQFREIDHDDKKLTLTLPCWPPQKSTKTL